MTTYYFLTVDGDIVFCSQEREKAETQREAEQDRLICQECAARDLRYPEDAERAMQSMDEPCRIYAVSEEQLDPDGSDEPLTLASLNDGWEEEFSREELREWILDRK